MALTLKNISRTGLGQLKIHFINGKKSTLTAWCNRYDMKYIKEDLKRSNGLECVIKSVYWNGVLLN